MKMSLRFKNIIPQPVYKTIFFPVLGAVVLLLGMNRTFAQTTNALDLASDPAYANAVPPNGLSPGGQNGGFGFGPWVFTVNGNGGAFISGSGPSGDSFDLWNTSGTAATFAVRPFISPLAAGQSFTVQLALNSLDGSSNTNALVLQDASGNTIFSYWHVGFEPNNGNNGSYSDATTNAGAAVGFHYNYQQFCSYTFTLNSSTTYTFTDNTTGASLSGIIAAGPIAQVAFVRGNGSAPGNGQDFQIDDLMITTSAAVAPPQFQQQTPGAGSFSAPTTNAISMQVVPGSVPINANSISLKIDGSVVTPTVTSSLGIVTVSYLPASPLSSGTTHTAQVILADNHNELFTNTWSFTTGFPSLPAVLPGPIVVSNNDITIFTALGDAWLGTNYGPGSSQTVYARFSMEFDSLNGETGNGGGYGGLHFFEGATGHLITGNNWPSLNWSFDTSEGLEDDLNPVTTIVLGEWHTIVERVDYAPGENAMVNIWLDPDFTQTEANQPNAPYTLTMDNTFDNIQLRTGNGTASATFTNVVIAATSAGAGFAAPAVPTFLGFVPGQNAGSAPVNSPISVVVDFGTYGISSHAITLNLDGNKVTPTFVVATNSITVNYQPAATFAAGSQHSVTVNLTDSNGAPASVSWSFTVDSYPTLPVTLAGPFEVSGGMDALICSNQNGWVSGNYEAASTNTLYARFSMTFNDVNGETGNGGAYGGLEFYQGTVERLLIGNNWLSTNWSTGGAGAANGQLPNADIPPVTPIVVGEWHTMVVKNVYSPNPTTNAAIEVWLDPDFTKSEGNQPNPPLTLSMNNTFDNIHLRCGNGTAYADFTNIVFAATAPGVGFAIASAPALLTIRTASGATQLSWTGTGTLQSAGMLTGPWADTANQNNPQALFTTNSAQFYRLRQ